MALNPTVLRALRVWQVLGDVTLFEAKKDLDSRRNKSTWETAPPLLLAFGRGKIWEFEEKEDSSIEVVEEYDVNSIGGYSDGWSGCSIDFYSKKSGLENDTFANKKGKAIVDLSLFFCFVFLFFILFYFALFYFFVSCFVCCCFVFAFVLFCFCFSLIEDTKRYLPF